MVVNSMVETLSALVEFILVNTPNVETSRMDGVVTNGVDVGTVAIDDVVFNGVVVVNGVVTAGNVMDGVMVNGVVMFAVKIDCMVINGVVMVSINGSSVVRLLEVISVLLDVNGVVAIDILVVKLGEDMVKLVATGVDAVVVLVGVVTVVVVVEERVGAVVVANGNFVEKKSKSNQIFIILAILRQRV